MSVFVCIISPKTEYTYLQKMNFTLYHIFNLCLWRHWPNELSVRQWSRRSGFNPRSSHTKDSKIVLDAALLTLCIIRYVSRIKWSNPGGGVAPSPSPRFKSYGKRKPSGHPRLRSLTYFYGISNIVGYLIPNPVYAHIVNIYQLLIHFVKYILKCT